MARHLPDAWLDELRARTDIAELVAEYVPLKQKGRRLWGLCPFHGEKTPSFSVDPDGQMFYCFGCHKGGTAIQFMMEIERMEFVEAAKALAERARFPLPDGADSDEVAAERARSERARVMEANLLAARFYHETLWKPEGAKALAYLHRRGLDDADIRRFGLGAAPDERGALTEHLQGKGFSFDELKRAGLAGERDGRRYDMFRGRAIFPIIDARGNVLGFGGRILGDGNPKYLNSPDTPAFNKRQGLYALNMIRKERNLARLLLVEGYMDVVSLRRRGVEGVAATLGTALTDEQARLIKRLAPEAWVCYDGDCAGQKAILRALDIFEEQGVPAKAIDLPEGMDPDEFAEARGIEAFKALKPISPAEYRMLRAADGLDMSQAEDRTKYALAACAILKRVVSPVELEGYVNELMLRTGFTREALMSQIGAPRVAGRQSEAQPKPRRAREPSEPAYAQTERVLLSMLADGLIGEALCPAEALITPAYIEAARLLAGGARPAAALDSLEDDTRSLAARAFATQHNQNADTAARAAEDCLAGLRIYKLNDAIERVKDEIKNEDDGDAKAALKKRLMSLLSELDLAKSGRKE